MAKIDLLLLTNNKRRTTISILRPSFYIEYNNYFTALKLTHIDFQCITDMCYKYIMKLRKKVGEKGKNR